MSRSRALYEMKTFSAHRGYTRDEHPCCCCSARALGSAGASPAASQSRCARLAQALSRARAVALAAKPGHSDTKDDERYMHLAGVVFRDEADALERRLLGDAAPETAVTDNQLTVPASAESRNAR